MIGGEWGAFQALQQRVGGSNTGSNEGRGVEPLWWPSGLPQDCLRAFSLWLPSLKVFRNLCIPPWGSTRGWGLSWLIITKLRRKHQEGRKSNSWSSHLCTVLSTSGNEVSDNGGYHPSESVVHIGITGTHSAQIHWDSNKNLHRKTIQFFKILNKIVPKPNEKLFLLIMSLNSYLQTWLWNESLFYLAYPSTPV